MNINVDGINDKAIEDVEKDFTNFVDITKWKQQDILNDITHIANHSDLSYKQKLLSIRMIIDKALEKPKK